MLTLCSGWEQPWRLTLVDHLDLLTRSVKDFYVLIVQPKKEDNNYEYGQDYKTKNSPPGKHYVTARVTPIGGMPDAFPTMGAVAFRPVLHHDARYHQSR